MALPPLKRETRVIDGSQRPPTPPATVEGAYRKMDWRRRSGRRRRGRSSPGGTGRGREKNADFRRLIQTLLVLGGFGMVTAVIVLLAGSGTPGSPVHTASTQTRASALPRPTVDDALEMSRRLLEASDPAEIESLIRPGRLGPDEALAFVKELPAAAAAPMWIGPIDSVRTPIEGVVQTFGPDRVRAVLITPDASGEWRIDFDAFARHSESPVPDLLDGRVDQAVHRLVGVRDYYYNSIYADEEQWACYSLKSLDHETIFYGYCLKESPQGRALASLEKLASDRSQQFASQVASEASPRPVAGSFRATLELRREPGAGARQFRISAVPADDWIIGETAFDSLEVFQQTQTTPPGGEGG